MTRLLPLTSVMTTAAAFAALCTGAGIAKADGFSQTNLVSNMPGLAAATDPNLVNPWGVSFANGSPVWISDQGTQTSPLFSVTGSTGVSNQPLFTVNIPPMGAAGPTGQVANALAIAGKPAGFDVTAGGGNGAPADFIFANLNGSISAWNGAPMTQAHTQTSVAGASFTGLAINQADTELFAANTAGAGGIDVFNNAFQQISLGAGAFATPTAIMAAGLVPFNVTDLGGNVFVTYAPSGHIPQTTATAGQGAVAEFSESGGLEKTIVGGPLASPWGVAIAPSSFGKFGGDLLVGNFSFANGVGDVINAFNPVTDALVGSIDVNPGTGTPGGLWSIVFGGGGSDGTPNTLFFTDGVNGETGGLFGSLTAVPEPSTWAMMLAGFGGLALFAARRRCTRVAIG